MSKPILQVSEVLAHLLVILALLLGIFVTVTYSLDTLTCVSCSSTREMIDFELPAKEPERSQAGIAFGYKLAMQHDTLTNARKIVLTRELYNPTELWSEIGYLTAPLDCSTPDARHGIGRKYWEEYGSMEKAQGGLKMCNAFNARVLKGWLGYMNAISAPSQADSRATGCLRNLLVPYWSQVPVVGKATEDILKQQAKTHTKQLSYQINGEYFLGGWTLLVLDSNFTGKRHLFYAANPLDSSPVAAWGSSAHATDKRELIAWLKKEAPGIPSEMGECWAEAVSHNQL